MLARIIVSTVRGAAGKWNLRGDLGSGGGSGHESMLGSGGRIVYAGFVTHVPDL